MKAPVYLSILMSFFVLFSACGHDKPTSTSNELAKMRQDLEAKKKELSDKQQIAEVEAELKRLDDEIKKVDRPEAAVQKEEASQAMAPPIQTAKIESSGPNGTIIGSGVVMRKESSVKSVKLGSFNQNEVVAILETKNVNNDNEAILTKSISLYTASNGSGDIALQLPKGKAVVLERYDADQNKHYVSYQDPAKGKLYAYVNSDAIETISYSTWYKVRRSNKQEGWVLGKFLKTN